MASEELTDLLIVSSEAVFPGNPGDLGLKLCGGKLLIPSSIADALEAGSVNIITASDLFLYLEEGPEEIAAALDWTLGSVQYAHLELALYLRNYIASEYISSPKRRDEMPLPDLSYVRPKRDYSQ